MPRSSSPPRRAALALVLDDVHRDEPGAGAAAWPVRVAARRLDGRASAAAPIRRCPLARLAAEGRLAELPLPELAFDDDEVAELVRLRGLGRDAELVEDLRRTAEVRPPGCLPA